MGERRLSIWKRCTLLIRIGCMVVQSAVVVQHSTAQHSTAQYSTVQYSTVQCTAPHRTAPHGTTLHHTAPHRTTLHMPCHAMPHRTTPHCTTPHHTALHCTTPHHTTPAVRTLPDDLTPLMRQKNASNQATRRQSSSCQRMPPRSSIPVDSSKTSYLSGTRVRSITHVTFSME